MLPEKPPENRQPDATLTGPHVLPSTIVKADSNTNLKTHRKSQGEEILHGSLALALGLADLP